MRIATSIAKILEEITLCNGNFGDPIVDCVDFEPIEVLRIGNADSQVGAGIALLVLHASAIENSTFQDALTNRVTNGIKEALSQGYCKQHPAIVSAFSAALESELAMNMALAEVYRTHVQRGT